MTSKPAHRVFIVDFDLVGYSGHYFNQAVGFREAARALALEARIYIPVVADPGIIEDLGARAILPRSLRWHVDQDAVLERFADSHRILAPLWKELDAEKISERDILIITSSRPQVIFGVGQWLGGQPSKARPAVFFKFFGPEFFDFEKMDFTEAGWSYHFAARIFANVPGGDRVLFYGLQQKCRIASRTLNIAADIPHAGTEVLRHHNERAGRSPDRSCENLSSR